LRKLTEMKKDDLQTHGPACPLCGTDNRKKRPHYAKLYGHYVCRKCYHGFANRRRVAFLIDVTAVFFLKDGFRGQSPGKFLTGVQVLNEETGQPAGFWASFKRNLPLLIPRAVIVVPLQLVRGHRLGDRWSRTEVVWKKYKDKAPFAVEAPTLTSPQ
jgi:hypothetical protein